MCASAAQDAPLHRCLSCTIGREHTNGDMISAIEINNGHARWSSMRIVPLI